MHFLLVGAQFLTGLSGDRPAETNLDLLRGPSPRLQRTLDGGRRDVIAADEEIVDSLYAPRMLADAWERVGDALRAATPLQRPELPKAMLGILSIPQGQDRQALGSAEFL